MDTAFNSVVKKLDTYIGSLVDMAEMPTEDKEALKAHLLAAQNILERNGAVKLISHRCIDQSGPKSVLR
jgi:hypothetical protein